MRFINNLLLYPYFIHGFHFKNTNYVYDVSPKIRLSWKFRTEKLCYFDSHVIWPVVIYVGVLDIYIIFFPFRKAWFILLLNRFHNLLFPIPFNTERIQNSMCTYTCTGFSELARVIVERLISGKENLSLTRYENMRRDGRLLRLISSKVYHQKTVTRVGRHVNFFPT